MWGIAATPSIVAGAMMLSCVPAAAQAPRFKPAPGEDLRAVYASSVDVAEGKRVADSSCARCHGANGISTTKGTPHIAGQRAGYLYQQLRAYQKRPRGSSAMEGAVRFLRDDALVAVSAYYASLEPARPAGGPSKPAPDSDPLAAGKAAAAACGGCHGEAGVTSMPGMPSLVGLDPKYFVTAMNAYKSGERKHDMMKSFATPLTEPALQNLALFYALQKPARAQTPASGDAAAGKKAAAACAGCHGESGVSSIPGTPSLAGQDAQYVAAATLAYKDGTRRDETMKGPAAALDQRSVQDLAAFYAGQEPQAPDVRKPLTLAEWTQRCDRCHGPNGNSIEPLMPALAAQRAEWLEAVLDAYRKGARKSTAMSAMSASLSDADLKALAAHYSRQPARPVVYVLVPGKTP